MAKNDKAEDDKGKKAKAKNAKGGKGEKGEAKGGKADKGGKGAGGEAPPYSSIATHPRAFASVRRARSWTGIGAFVIAAGLSLKAGVPFSESLLRALGAGLAGYLLVWWGSMRIWRQLMIAEQRAAIAEINRRRAERSGELGDNKATARG
jgi:hypothetical protein